MTYDQQILQILTDVGERGISVAKLAKHVYNMNCTFFSTPDLQEIQQYTGQYLLRNSKSPKSLIERTGRRGYYRLNTQGSADARQLLLQFRNKADGGEAEPAMPRQDLSLSLFPELD